MAKTEAGRQRAAEAKALGSVAHLHRKVSCGVNRASRQLSNVVDRFFRLNSEAASRAVSTLSSNQPPNPYSALPSIWLRLGGDDIEAPSPKAIPLSSCLGMQFKWKIFPLFCVRFLARKQIIFSPCEKALTPIYRRLQGCVARIVGRVRMGHTKARRNLDATGRAGQTDRIVITFSELIVLMLPPLSSSRPALP